MKTSRTNVEKTHLEPLILQNFLDSNILSLFGCGNYLGLENDSKGAIADDFAMAVGYLPMIARLSIGGYDLYDLRRIINGYYTCR